MRVMRKGGGRISKASLPLYLGVALSNHMCWHLNGLAVMVRFMKPSLQIPTVSPISPKRGMCLSAITLGVLFALSAFPAEAGEAHSLTSPDGRIRISIKWPAPGSAGRPSWSATFQGKPILRDSQLGLQIADAGDLMAGVQRVRERSRTVSRRISVLFGKSAHADDRFCETRFT